MIFYKGKDMGCSIQPYPMRQAPLYPPLVSDSVEVIPSKSGRSIFLLWVFHSVNLCQMPSAFNVFLIISFFRRLGSVLIQFCKK